MPLLLSFNTFIFSEFLVSIIACISISYEYFTRKFPIGQAYDDRFWSKKANRIFRLLFPAYMVSLYITLITSYYKSTENTSTQIGSAASESDTISLIAAMLLLFLSCAIFAILHFTTAKASCDSGTQTEYSNTITTYDNNEIHTNTPTITTLGTAPTTDNITDTTTHDIITLTAYNITFADVSNNTSNNNFGNSNNSADDNTFDSISNNICITADNIITDNATTLTNDSTTEYACNNIDNTNTNAATPTDDVSIESVSKNASIADSDITTPAGDNPLDGVPDNADDFNTSVDYTVLGGACTNNDNVADNTRGDSTTPIGDDSLDSVSNKSGNTAYDTINNPANSLADDTLGSAYGNTDTNHTINIHIDNNTLDSICNNIVDAADNLITLIDYNTADGASDGTDIFIDPTTDTPAGDNNIDGTLSNTGNTTNNTIITPTGDCSFDDANTISNAADNVTALASCNIIDGAYIHTENATTTTLINNADAIATPNTINSLSTKSASTGMSDLNDVPSNYPTQTRNNTTRDSLPTSSLPTYITSSGMTTTINAVQATSSTTKDIAPDSQSTQTHQEKGLEEEGISYKQKFESASTKSNVLIDNVQHTTPQQPSGNEKNQISSSNSSVKFISPAPAHAVKTISSSLITKSNAKTATPRDSVVKLYYSTPPQKSATSKESKAKLKYSKSAKSSATPRDPEVKLYYSTPPKTPKNSERNKDNEADDVNWGLIIVPSDTPVKKDTHIVEEASQVPPKHTEKPVPQKSNKWNREWYDNTLNIIRGQELLWKRKAELKARKVDTNDTPSIEATQEVSNDKIVQSLAPAYWTKEYYSRTHIYDVNTTEEPSAVTAISSPTTLNNWYMDSSKSADWTFGDDTRVAGTITPRNSINETKPFREPVSKENQRNNNNRNGRRNRQKNMAKPNHLKKRCRTWPNCTNLKNCSTFSHPEIDCRNGSSCRYRLSCAFIHHPHDDRSLETWMDNPSRLNQ